VGFGNIFVRANYLATAVFGSLLALICGTFVFFSMGTSPILDRLVAVAISLGAMSLFLIPGIRAIRRFAANGTVIPPALVHERPVVAGVVTLAGGFGHCFFVISMAVAIGIALAPEWPEEAGKIAGPILAALFLYFIALWGGEFMKKGTDLFIDGTPSQGDAPRILKNRSVPFIHARP
jgi:hypothetical protein